jgi:PAS domain S-box-containing protein
LDSLQQQQFAINLMEHLVTATFVLDDTGKVIIWNKACERLTGIKASEVIGTDSHWQAFYSEKRPCLADLLVQNVLMSSMNCMFTMLSLQPMAKAIRQKTGVIFPVYTEGFISLLIQAQSMIFRAI